MSERRSRLRLSYDLMTEISKTNRYDEYQGGKTTLKLTNIQLGARMAYDKTRENILQLEKLGYIELHPPRLTNEGFWFLKEYGKIIEIEDILKNNVVDTEYKKPIILPIESNQHKLKDALQVINVQKAIIQVLEK